MEMNLIENITSKEQVARNSLTVIDTSIKEKSILKQDFNISEEGKWLNSRKNSRRNDCILIINVIESITDREIEIDNWTRKEIILVFNLIGLESTRIT